MERSKSTKFPQHFLVHSCRSLSVAWLPQSCCSWLVQFSRLGSLSLPESVYLALAFKSDGMLGRIFWCVHYVVCYHDNEKRILKLHTSFRLCTSVALAILQRATSHSIRRCLKHKVTLKYNKINPFAVVQVVQEQLHYIIQLRESLQSYLWYSMYSLVFHRERAV